MPAPTKKQAKDLFAVHDGPEAASERQRRSLGLDSSRTWVDPAGKQLSDRVWDARQGTRKQIDYLLRESIRNGEDALVTAKKLEQFLDPSLAPIRTERGRLVRNQRRGIVTQAPGRGGSGSYPARRLARTEISRAHAQATELAGAGNPFAKGLKWTLSGSHPKADPCDENARRDVGLGPGIYPLGELPLPDPPKPGIGRAARPPGALPVEGKPLGIATSDYFKQIDPLDHEGRSAKIRTTVPSTQDIRDQRVALERQSARLAGPLTKEERRAFIDYTSDIQDIGQSGSSYVEVNRYARKGIARVDEAATTRSIALLDQAFARDEAVLDRDVKVFRRTVFTGRRPDELANAQPGSVLTDWGYGSYSTSQLTTKNFGNAKTEGPRMVDYEIVAPKGSRAIPLHKLSKKQGEKEAEEEMLMARGSTFIVHNTRTNDQGVLIIRGELLVEDQNG